MDPLGSLSLQGCKALSLIGIGIQLQVTELIDKNEGVFWVLMIVWLNSIELTDNISLLILFDKWNQSFKNYRMTAAFSSRFR